MNPRQTLLKIREQHSQIILFHSATGKDSIVLLDLCAPIFEKVICIFMYVVKDLDHIDSYINWAEKKYPNCKFEKVPHFHLNRIIKFGQLGLQARPKTILSSLTKISTQAQKAHNIKYSIFGFKKSDSLNRRLSLNSFGNIIEKSGSVYPLSEWTNKTCLQYIKSKNLIHPQKYDSQASSGVDVMSGAYLSWLKKNYPEDLEKVFKSFPLAESFLFEYEHKEEV